MKTLTNFASDCNRASDNSNPRKVDIHTKADKMAQTSSSIYWVNQYGHRGHLMNSTPYGSFEDAKNDIESFVSALANYSGSEKTIQYKKISDTYYLADNGGSLRIEKNGDIITHLQTIWIGVCANYGTNFPSDRLFIEFLTYFVIKDIDEAVWSKYADSYCSDNAFRKKIDTAFRLLPLLKPNPNNKA